MSNGERENIFEFRGRGAAGGAPTGDTDPDPAEALANKNKQSQQGPSDQPFDAEAATRKESDYKRSLQEWLEQTVDAVIKAVLEDSALPFIEKDIADDEQSGAFDLTGDYDPVLEGKPSIRLSDNIRQAAEKFRRSEKVLHRLYLNRLKEKWAGADKKAPLEPKGEFYGPCLVNRHGAWIRQTVAGIEDLPVWRRITKTRIDPVALSYDTTPQQNWKHHFLVTGETGEQLVPIDKVHLGKAANPAINELIRRGVIIVETNLARQHLARFLRYRPRKRIIRLKNVGWHLIRGHWLFVLPDEVICATDKIHVMLDGVEAGEHGFERVGTTKQWGQDIAGPLSRHSNVVLAVGTMLAAAVLRFCGEPGGGFHLYGDSKAGKTLIAVIAQSVWGRPFVPGSGDSGTFGFDWDSTAARLEERAVLRNDVGLSLDGIEGGDEKAVRRAIYRLMSGQGRGRMGRPEAAFTLLVLSVGEVSVVKFLGNARAGQTVRLTDIPVEVRPGNAFEEFCPDVAGKRFYAAARDCHGSVGYEFVRFLVDQTPRRFQPRLTELREAFLADAAVDGIRAGAHSQVISVIHRFALISATLALAIEAKLLPWKTADSNGSLIACMRRWLDQRGNKDTSGELLSEIAQRRKRIAVIINDRFVRLTVESGRLAPASEADQHKMQVGEFDGYIKIKDGRILVKPDAWQRWWAGLNVEEVNKHLQKAELLIPDPKGKASRLEAFKSGEPPARFYVLVPAFIGSV